MKAFYTSIMIIVLFACTQSVSAQDYNFYLQKARQRIAEGDCEGAQRNYNVYKDVAKKTDNDLEQMIEKCCTAKNNHQNNSQFNTMGYLPTATGLYYKQKEKGNGKQLKIGDVIKVNIAYYINDSLLFTTDSLPEQAYDMVRESVFQGDLYEGFRMMHVGDAMSFMINADSVFRKQFQAQIIPDFVTPDTFLRWEVKVDEAMTEEVYQQMRQDEMVAKQQKAQADFNAYLVDNGIDAQPLESGLIYVCTQKGRGLKPTVNQKVKVHYNGKLLNGTVFDSSFERGEPIEFPLGVGRVIPGLDEGIGLMSKGEKGILYIPFHLAYGSREVGSIPEFSNLIFEVELVDFK